MTWLQRMVTVNVAQCNSFESWITNTFRRNLGLSVPGTDDAPGQKVGIARFSCADDSICCTALCNAETSAGMCCSDHLSNSCLHWSQHCTGQVHRDCEDEDSWLHRSFR